MREVYVPSVKELLDTASAKYGDRTFIKYAVGDQVVEKSFNQLKKDSYAVCRQLRAVSDDQLHVAIIGKTTYEFLVYATGILISGNVLIPFAPETSLDEADKLFTRADVDAMVFDSSFQSRKDEINKRFQLKLSIDYSEPGTLEDTVKTFSEDSQYASLSDYNVDKEKLSVLIFTSGTTGVKKGVMLSQKAFVGNIMYGDYIEIFTDKDICLSVLPMYHCFCLSGDFIKNLKDGLTICLNTNMRDITKNLILFEPTVIRIVPMMAQTLLKLVHSVKSKEPNLTNREAAEKVFGKNIKWLISGGAYLPPDLVKSFDELGINLRQGYGMTEAGCRISVPDDYCSAESVGRVTDICEVRIKGGEIQVKNDTLMLGYYKMPEETKAMFTNDGWLRTGDIGSVTEDGQLFITGRLKNLIILSSGENVSPEAIEKKFHKYNFISEILIFAENDRLVAEIYPDYDYFNENHLDAESTIKDVIKELNCRAKPSHVIAEIRITDQPLEKTGSGKIKRKGAKL